MGETIDKTANSADIAALPPNVVGEILCDRLVPHPRPAPRPTYAASALGGALMGTSQVEGGRARGGIVLFHPDPRLEDHVIITDPTGWRVQRTRELPTSAKGDPQLSYALSGVTHPWCITPAPQALEALIRDEADWTPTHTFFDGVDVNTPPFDAVTFSLGAFWPDGPDAPHYT